MPEDFDLTGAEAHHLIVTVDADKDEKLTKVIFIFDEKLLLLYYFLADSSCFEAMVKHQEKYFFSC